jgi:hypothetical protein
MGFGLITPAENSCLWNVRGEKILEPVNVVLCCPAVFAFSIEAMNRDDAMMH